MSSNYKFIGALMGLFVLGACAAEEPVIYVKPDIVYNKLGEPQGCVDQTGSSVPCTPPGQGCASQTAGCDPYTAGSDSNSQTST